MNLKNEIDSKRLLQRLQEGDRDAFDLIFKLYWDPILLYLSKLVVNRQHNLDIIQ